VKLPSLFSRRARGAGRDAPGQPRDEIHVTKVDDAAFFVAKLFADTFGDPVPGTPTHYVAFRKLEADRLEAVGYYHVAYCGEYALVGGLCVDPRMRRRGVGEMLERYVYRDAGATKAYFAHVGDPRRSRRVGFADTGHPHLMVCWMAPLPDEERRRLIAEVAALGPF
jgi:GNAT superfamily N-acetyltransferase